MRDFILLMHDDATADTLPEAWPRYFADLRERGVFDGGSAIGAGATFRRQGDAAPVSMRIGGYIRVRAESLAAAADLLVGNPIYESGGTVEIRDLPRG